MLQFRGWVGLLLGLCCFSASQASDYPDSYIERELGVIRAGMGVTPSSIALGQMQIFNISHLQFAIYRRTAADLVHLKDEQAKVFQDKDGSKQQNAIRDAYWSSVSLPGYFLNRSGQATIDGNPLRSLADDYFVFRPYAPTTGCYVQLLPIAERQNGAVFLDPCTRHTFDAAGRFVIPEETGEIPDGMHHLLVIPYRLVAGGRFWVAGSTVDMTTQPTAVLDYRSPGLLLLTAVSFNRQDLMEQALRQGASANFRSPVFGRVINRAVRGSSSEIVRRLVELGAEPDEYTLDLARGYGRQDIVELLSGR